MDLSFIIPAYNEEKNIPSTVQSIKKNVPPELSFEIIVVDNGSEDRTVTVSAEYGAVVFQQSESKIGGLRNYGAKKSSGQFLVFLDADVHLTEKWGENIQGLLKMMLAKRNIISGSFCSTPDNPSKLEKTWFKGQDTSKKRYINSGHMIIERKYFMSLGGFDERLDTGEDFELSKRVRLSGGYVFVCDSVKVIHYGYPKTLSDFYKREKWHGRGDCKSVSSIVSSKVAIASIVFALINLLFIISILLGCILLGGLFLFMVILIVIIVTAKRLGNYNFNEFVYGMCLSYVYLFARVMSCFKSKSLRDHTRGCRNCL